MKKLIPILLLAIVACTSPNKNEFTITGKVTGDTTLTVYLQVFEKGKMQNIDTAELVNGTFEFKGSVAYPDNYFIRIGEIREKISFFIENSKILIIADIDSLSKADIVGSTTHNNYLAYKDSKANFQKEKDQIEVEHKKAETEKLKRELETKWDSIDNVERNHIKSYVKANGNSILAPYIIRRELIHSIDLKELEELTNAISPELKDYKYTKILLERIEILRNLQPGKLAPEFTQNDVNGNPVNLADFRGNYLLIDFWASWCGPCRKANPTVVKIYKKYSKKNFDILGVSMDSKKEAWLKAIEDDNLTWTHVSTLEGWANPVGKKYGVNSIPHAILIDPEGKIVKRGIHASELEKVLSELIK